MSDDVIDNYDLDNNALFIRGCNLIDIPMKTVICRTHGLH